MASNRSAPRGLQIRKLADKSEGERIVRFDPVTGQRKLVNPSTEGDDHEPWPLAGVAIEGEAPKACKVPTSFVTAGLAEGWIELGETTPVHRAGGPESNPWAVTHTFLQADTVTLKCVDGDVRYRVTHQPDKYDDPDEPSGKRVDWFYGLELEA